MKFMNHILATIFTMANWLIDNLVKEMIKLVGTKKMV